MTSIRRVGFITLVCACAVAGLTGCGSGTRAPFPCVNPPPPRAWAMEMTTAGLVRWQTPLATQGQPFGALAGAPMSALVFGGIAVFAQDDVVYGLRLADGRRSWSWTSPQPVAGMWRWQGMVVVLAGPRPGSDDMPRLAGLDASTGQARWKLRIPGIFPYITENLGVTADGGLAMVSADGVLQVVDLSGGRVRWTRPLGPLLNSATGNMQWAMAVAPGIVLVAVNGRLTSYDDRTGGVRWTEALMPIQLADRPHELSLQVYAGLVYLSAVQQRTAGQRTPVLLGISAVNGRIKWRFVAGPQEALQAYAAGLVYASTDIGFGWLYRIDPATGRVRWRVAWGDNAVDPLATSAGFVTVSSLSGTDEIRMRDATTGVSRWVVRLSDPTGGRRLPLLRAGPLVIVTAGGASADMLAAFRIADGQRVWEITMPERLLFAVSAVPGGILVQPATVYYGCA